MKDSKRTAKRRLTNLDFSQEKCHVALVDHGAIEHDELLVLKRKNTELTPDDITVNKNKEDDMSLDNEKHEEILKAKLAGEAKIEELVKAAEAKEAELKELLKAQEEQAEKLAEVEKKAADQAEKLEEVEKARVAKVREEMVCKAKELKADDADKFGDILVKCKDALEDEEYSELVKQLEKLQNIDANSEVLKDLGESAGNSEIDDEKKFQEKRAAHIEKGLSPRDASRKARLELTEESK